MNTLYNAVTGAATAAKEAVVGKDEKQEQAEKSGIEPSSSSEPGKADAGTGSEPYDKGNLPTPLSSPTTAAHTDPTPVSPKIDEETKETNADTSGPSVGNAKLVPDPNAPNPTPPEVPTAAAVTIPSPAQAENEIKADAAKELEKEKTDEQKAAEVERSDFAAPDTPKTKKVSDAVAAVKDSPATSTSSLKKRLSTRIKEKLHIGSSHKKDKPAAS